MDSFSGSPTIIPFEISRAADDLDPAIGFFYDGSGDVATVDIDTAVANTVRLTVDGVNTDFLLSDALFNTFGELKNAVEALAKVNGAGWHCRLKAAYQSDLTYSTNTKILAVTAANAKVIGGKTCFWDTSRILHRSACVGMEEILLRKGGDPVPFLAQDQSDTITPASRIPGSGETFNATSQNISGGRAAVLEEFRAVGSFGGGVASWQLRRCTQLADGPLYTKAGAATTVESAYTPANFSELQGLNEERVVVRYVNTTTVITSSTLAVKGRIIQARG